MEISIIVSGFGGQGTLFAGQVLAYAALDNGKEVTWIPSYGPEMRGGTAHCTIIISDDEIGSPLTRNPYAVVALNLPSVDKYEHLLQSDGIMIVNASLIDRPVERPDIRKVLIPANEIAEEIGDRRLTNMVAVGALMALLPTLSLEAVAKALEDHLPVRHRKLLPANRTAMQRGYDFALESLKV